MGPNMVITCAGCKQKMRIDETRIPPGEKVKIRCPHCGAIGTVPTDSEPAVSPPHQLKTTAQQPQPSLNPTEHRIPSDAFQNFRFPAEQGRKADQKKLMTKRNRLILVIIASIVWIALFALIVNLILHFRPFSTSGYEEREPTTTQRNR